MSLDKLRRYDLRFCKINKGEKRPFENNWQKEPHNYEEISKWVAKGNNYGICCGYNNLIVIDCDEDILIEHLQKQKLPKTFTVKTGGGGIHYYYFCKGLDKKIILQPDGPESHCGEVQSWGTQVVGPGSLHPNGQIYTILDNSAIQEISREELLDVLSIFIKPMYTMSKVKETKKTDLESDIQSIPILNVISVQKQRQMSNGQILGENPWHGSTNGGNFCVDPSANLAFCFRCDKGMNAAQVIALEQGIISGCGDYLDKDKFLKTLEIAQAKYGLKRIKAKDSKKPKEEQEEIIEYASFLELKPLLYEQIVDENGESYFLEYDTDLDICTSVKEVKHEGITYRPIAGEEVKKQIVGLPKNIVEYGSSKELDRDIAMFISKWLDIDETYRKFAVYNIRKSWVYDKFHTLNYLRALGEYGTGKSRYLDTLGLLHYKPVATSGAITSAVIFRLIEKWHGTLIIDEADRKNSDESDDVIKIINQGYEKGRFVIRCDKEKGYELRFFDTFCPKVLATRREFEDKATESRCLTTVMKSTQRKNIPPNLNNEFFKELDILRSKLLLWRFRNYYAIDPDVGERIDLSFLEPRLRQISTGFFSMFAEDQEEIEHFKTFLKEHQQETINQRSETVEGRIINGLAELIKSSMIANGILILTDDTIQEFPITAQMIAEKGEIYEIGRLMDSRKISKHMKALGFAPAVSRKIGPSTYRTYIIKTVFLREIFLKYISDDELLVFLEKSWLR